MPKTSERKSLPLPLILPFAVRVAMHFLNRARHRCVHIEDTSVYKDFMLQSEEYEAQKAAEKKKES